MAHLILPSRRIVQPPGAVEVDWANPLTLGLRCVASPAISYGISPIVVGSSLSVSVNALGRGWSGFGSSGYLSLTPPSMTEGSALYVTQLPALGVVQAVSNLGQANASFVPYSNNNIYLADFASNRYVSGVAVPGGVNGLLNGYSVASAGAANFHAAYINGVYAGSSNSLSFSMPSVVYLGSSGIGHYLNGHLNLFALWSRRLLNDELADISTNPWQLFKPVQRRIYFDVGAGGGLSVNATQATADASGNAATVDRQLAITVSQATASASGYGAGVSFGLTISAIQATADASGYLAGIDRHIDVVATTGTASASGYDASVQFGNDLAIAASYGLASADGYQAAVNLQAAINATAATASASGYDAAIVSGGLSLTAADLAAIDALIVARVSDIAAATLAAATAAGGIDANMLKTNGTGLKGDGTEANKFRSVLVA